MSASGSVLTVNVPNGFDLAAAVCSYGYFVLAPNHWDAARSRLHRPLRGAGGRLIRTSIHQRRPGKLAIRCDAPVNRAEASTIRSQVRRMLRVDEEFDEWHRVHRAARRAGFGRLFRSPDLFEDAIKTITGCNVSWPNTIRMNQLLCRNVGGGGFPTPDELGSMRPSQLKRMCKVGYRAERIIALSRRVARGELDLSWFEDVSRTTQQIAEGFGAIHGIGPYAAANLCQSVGRYDRLAIDSETYRHFRQVHGVPTTKNKAAVDRRICRHYDKYAPYQFLAYWFELWTGYQEQVGDSRQCEADDEGARLTAR